MAMKLTRKQAIELSIKKWKWIVGNDGDDTDLTLCIAGLDDLISHCGLCEFNETSGDGFCESCPILINGISCGDLGHPWDKWERNRTKENAQKVLDLIKSKL